MLIISNRIHCFNNITCEEITNNTTNENDYAIRDYKLSFNTKNINDNVFYNKIFNDDNTNIQFLTNTAVYNKDVVMASTSHLVQSFAGVQLECFYDEEKSINTFSTVLEDLNYNGTGNINNPIQFVKNFEKETLFPYNKKATQLSAAFYLHIVVAQRLMFPCK